MENLEPLYVADTHTLLWYLSSHRRLGPRVGLIFQAALRGETRIVVSAIVLAELYYLNLKQSRAVDFSELFLTLKKNPAFRLVPFDSGDVLDFERDSSITEMHDRIIAGLARRLNAPLLTIDPVIIQSGLVKIEW